MSSLQDKDILSADATVIAGILILTSIYSVIVRDGGETQPKEQLGRSTKHVRKKLTKLSSTVLIPFAASAVVLTNGQFIGTYHIGTVILNAHLIGAELMNIGFIYLAIAIAAIVNEISLFIKSRDIPSPK